MQMHSLRLAGAKQQQDALCAIMWHRSALFPNGTHADFCRSETTRSLSRITEIKTANVNALYGCKNGLCEGDDLKQQL
jgi:hypothetical protein